MFDQIFSFRSAGSILFGFGALEKLAGVIKDLGLKKICLVTDRPIRALGLADRVVKGLEAAGIHAAVFDAVAPEPDLDSVTACAKLAGEAGAEGFVGLGGGSPMDVAKGAAVLAAHGGGIQDYLGVDRVPGPTRPKILVPTTAGTGSEVTPFAVFKDPAAPPEKKKTAIQSRHVVAEAAVVDPDLTLTCPARVTAVSGLDALVHAVESFTSVNASPLSANLSLTAVELIGQSLPAAFGQGRNRAARYNLALGALYAGLGIANAGSGGVAALSYPVEGYFNVIHGIGNALFLPHVLRYNSLADHERMKAMARVLNLSFSSGPEAAESLADFVNHLLQEFRLPARLTELGVIPEDLPRLAADAVTRQRLLTNNLREMKEEDILSIYKAAL